MDSDIDYLIWLRNWLMSKHGVRETDGTLVRLDMVIDNLEGRC